MTGPKPTYQDSGVPHSKVWKPVEILWNDEKFLVIEEPSCIKISDQYGESREKIRNDHLYCNATDKGDLYSLTLVGKEISLTIYLILESASKATPDSLTTDKKHIDIQESGKIEIKGTTKNIRCTATWNITCVLEGKKYAISSDYERVLDKETCTVYSDFNLVLRLALKHMVEKCPKKSKQVFGETILDLVQVDHKKQSPFPASYRQVSHLFRIPSRKGSGTKIFITFYGRNKLVRNTGKTGMYWLEMN